ncbi:MAG: DUF4062 domain-containing protein [Chthoniobacteraceae bacterium]
MGSNKFQIFVSSTYTDLVDVRRGLMEVLQSLNHFPVGMEQFSADDDEQWEIIRETLEQTDYYICIIGHRYGSLSIDGRSFTEKEWDYARELGVAIMSFIRNRNVATTPQERESDSEQTKRLDAFIAKVKTDKMVDFWSDANDLNQKVIIALTKAFSRKPRPGWIRSQSGQVAEQLAKLVEENRVLRDQLEKLNSEIMRTSPWIEVELNGRSALDFKFFDDKYLNLTNPPYLPHLEWSNIPADLQRFITNEEVEQYNSARLESDKMASEVAEIRQMERMKRTAHKLEICISNKGSAKAREIFLDLEFPDSVLVLEKDEFTDLNVPVLKVPENPLEKARATKAKVEAMQVGDWVPMIEPSMFHIETINRNIMHQLLPRTRSLRVEKNKISIWMEDLMHTREQIFLDVVVIPLKKGNFKVQGTVICEEFGAPNLLELPLIIDEGNAVDLPNLSFLPHD